MTTAYRPLPRAKVDELWAKLTVVYGQAFLRQYEGIKLEEAKAEWAAQLGGFVVVRDEGRTWPAIFWALDRLPPRAPNVIEFRQLCRGYAPPAAPLGLPSPPRSVPQRFREQMAQLSMPVQDTRPQWIRDADRFVALHGHKTKLSPLQKNYLAHYRALQARWAKQLEAEKAKKETSDATATQ